ncbi:MAG: hypothetical protein HKP30_01935 [Myxococcales bacterium]|nr:hypothetical protein [Myxococcales bacterium]
MRYDPFARGPHPVGVVTLSSKDALRERELPLEIWYPAHPDQRGRDLDPASQAKVQPMPAAAPLGQAAVRDVPSAPGPHPVVAFSHGFAGHRCQSTFLCTHLASHGYVVVAPDHVGNTTVDVMTQAMQMLQEQGKIPGPEELSHRIQEIADLRPGDLGHALDRVLSGSVALLGEVDASRVAVTGHSFGGWTTLMTTGLDRRIRAAVPLAPAGGETDLPSNPFESDRLLAWDRDVPTLYLVADRDSVLPLRGMHQLYADTRGPRRMVILEDADHQHFCDNAEQVHELMRAMPLPGIAGSAALKSKMAPFAELTPAGQTEQAIRGLTLAHFDAVLNAREEACELLADVGGVLAALGLRADVA